MAKTMTSKEKYELKKHLKAAATIIYNNTPKDQLQTFESLELALRDQLQIHVQPEFGDFFGKHYRDNSRKKKADKNLCGRIDS